MMEKMVNNFGRKVVTLSGLNNVSMLTSDLDGIFKILYCVSGSMCLSIVSVVLVAIEWSF